MSYMLKSLKNVQRKKEYSLLKYLNSNIKSDFRAFILELKICLNELGLPVNEFIIYIQFILAKHMFRREL